MNPLVIFLLFVYLGPLIAWCFVHKVKIPKIVLQTTGIGLYFIIMFYLFARADLGVCLVMLTVVVCCSVLLHEIRKHFPEESEDKEKSETNLES